MGTAVTGTPNPFLDTANWQGVDDEPTAGSENLVKSGGVKLVTDTLFSGLHDKLTLEIGGIDNGITYNVSTRARSVGYILPPFSLSVDDTQYIVTTYAKYRVNADGSISYVENTTTPTDVNCIYRAVFAKNNWVDTINPGDLPNIVNSFQGVVSNKITSLRNAFTESLNNLESSLKNTIEEAKLEIGSIQLARAAVKTSAGSGVLIPSNNRVTTKNYCRAPFKISTNSGYRIRVVAKYTINIDGSITYDSTENVFSTEFIEHNPSFVYRIVFDKNDSTISEEELPNIVKSYTEILRELVSNNAIPLRNGVVKTSDGSGSVIHSDVGATTYNYLNAPFIIKTSSDCKISILARYRLSPNGVVSYYDNQNIQGDYAEVADTDYVYRPVFLKSDGSAISNSELDNIVSVYKNYIDIFDERTSEKEKSFGNVYAPSPQKPANNSSDADFNAETITPSELYTAFDGLVNGIPAPYSYYRRNPKFITQNKRVGRDASNTYDIKSYILTKRNVFGWIAAEKLFAWKDGNNNIVYTDDSSPRVGDTIYANSSRTASGTVQSYEPFTINGTYVRNSSSDIQADIIYTRACLPVNSTGATVLAAYNENLQSLGNATYVDSTHITINSKVYERDEALDYHTDNKHTIVIWANEHGPQSDPEEGAIICYRLAKDLIGGCRNNPFIEYLKNYCKIILIPCVNPYGMVNKTRNNANNVNINRNYNTKEWEELSDADKGSYAGDQNETQYVMNTCLLFNPDIAIDVHCFGYVTETNVGRCQIYTPNGTVEAMQDIMRQFGLEPEIQQSWTAGQGGTWIKENNILGSLVEMNAGDYATAYDGKQHTEYIMEANYTLLLNSINNGINQTL